MPSTMPFDFGDVVLVQFPFTDQTSTKQRPAAVVNSEAYDRERPDVILLAVTSQVHLPARFGEAVVEDWKTAGLLKPSMLKPVLTTVEKSIVRRRLGKLVPKDRERLQQIVREIVSAE